MKSVALNAFPRTQTRRKGSRAVRAVARIPAIIYGKTAASQNLEIDAKEFDTLVHKAHSEIILVDLSITGGSGPKRLALVQDVQHHALTGAVLHVDLHEVRPDERVTIKVPVEPVGEAVGVKTGGGTLEHVLLRLKIRALPKDLPEQINIDVSTLEVGKSIHIGEVKAPEGVEILGDKGIPVFAVAAPVTEAQEAAATAPADGKQPEMIKEKKEDGAAPAADAKGAAKKDEKPAEKKK